MDDGDDIHDRLEQLEATVADQQQTIEQLSEPPAVGRRSVVASLLGAGALGGLAGYGSQRSRAQASGPAGQVGTGEEPVDGFLWDLDVQNGAAFNGNPLTGVGALEAGSVSTDALESGVAGSGNTITSVSDNAGEYRQIGVIPWFQGETISTTSTSYVSVGSSNGILNFDTSNVATNTNIESDLYGSVGVRFEGTAGSIRLFDSPNTEVSGDGFELGPIGIYNGGQSLRPEFKSDTGSEVSVSRIAIQLFERIA